MLCHGHGAPILVWDMMIFQKFNHQPKASSKSLFCHHHSRPYFPQLHFNFSRSGYVGVAIAFCIHCIEPITMSNVLVLHICISRQQTCFIPPSFGAQNFCMYLRGFCVTYSKPCHPLRAIGSCNLPHYNFPTNILQCMYICMLRL